MASLNRHFFAFSLEMLVLCVFSLIAFQMNVFNVWTSGHFQLLLCSTTIQMKIHTFGLHFDFPVD